MHRNTPPPMAVTHVRFGYFAWAVWGTSKRIGNYDTHSSQIHRNLDFVSPPSKSQNSENFASLYFSLFWEGRPTPTLKSPPPSLPTQAIALRGNFRCFIGTRTPRTHSVGKTCGAHGKGIWPTDDGCSRSQLILKCGMWSPRFVWLAWFYRPRVHMSRDNHG